MKKRTIRLDDNVDKKLVKMSEQEDRSFSYILNKVLKDILFPSKTKERKSKVIKKNDENAIYKEAVDIYYKAYKEKYKQSPVFGAIQGRALKTIIKNYKREDVLLVCEIYPSYSDPWDIKHRHSLVQMQKSFAKVLTDYRSNIGQVREIEARGMVNSKIRRQTEAATNTISQIEKDKAFKEQQKIMNSGIRNFVNDSRGISNGK